MIKRFTLTVPNGIDAVVDATKLGNEWKALCPFHEDKIPSLSINEEKGVYYCHACGEKGKIANFNAQEICIIVQ